MIRPSLLMLQASAWSGLAPGRCVFGSNYPIEKIWTGYGPIVKAYEDAIAHWMRLIKQPSWQITPRAFIGYSIRNYSLRRVRAPITLNDVPERTPLAL